MGSVIRKLAFWDFPRTSWPYDVVVTLILIFIFVTPRSWFRDQPHADRVVLLSSTDAGSVRVYIEPGSAPECTGKIAAAKSRWSRSTSERGKCLIWYTWNLYATRLSPK